MWLGILLLLHQTISVIGFTTSAMVQQQRHSGMRLSRPPSSTSTTALDSTCIDRKSMLKSAFSLIAINQFSLMNPQRVAAVGPQAPIETLLPAVRVKLSIDRAIALTKQMMDSPDPASSPAIEGLKGVLLKPQNYTKTLKLQGVPQSPAALYLDAYKPMKGDLPFQRYLIKNGDVSTWKGLKKKEKEQERDNEVRAALNAYTDALSFSSSSYLLNVDKFTRSNMVREDRLPDVKQVITSDMGMRYLYRNQVLTTMDDVRAECEYMVEHLDDNVDGGELLSLLVLAQRACDRWFELIDPIDVKEAFLILEASKEYID